jgi:phosphatidylglycerol---prolipoprotein diacylglyceryl transferase
LFPRLVQFGNFFLPTYGVLAALGLIVGLMVAVHLGRRSRIDPEKMWNEGIIAVIAGVLGAKLLLIINDWSRYSKHPAEIFSLATLQAAGVFSGGLLLAILACYLYAVRAQMPKLKTADAFAPGIAIGHAFGRLGCFAAGCCYGKATNLPWGVTFKNPLANQLVGTPLGVSLHPTQLYEFLVEVIIFVLLMILFRRKSFDGQIAALYMFLYGIGRYFLEFVRDDPERGSMFGGIMTVTQFIAILLVIGGAVMWIACSNYHARTVSATA